MSSVPAPLPQNAIAGPVVVPADTGGLKRQSVRGGVAALASQGAKFILQIGGTAVLARLLVPADFGLVGMVAAVTGFVALFKDLGLSTATIQRAEVTHEQVSTLFWINVALSVGLGLIVAAAAPAIAAFYGEPRLTLVTLATAATFLFGGMSAQHVALLQRHMRFASMARIEVASAAVATATGVALGFAGAGYWALVGMSAAGSLAYMAGTWLASPWRPGLPRRGVGVRSFLSFGASLSVGNFFHYVAYSSETVLIGRFLGAGPVGLYSKTSNLVLTPSRQLMAPMSRVLFPALSRLTHDPGRFRAAGVRALELVALVTVPTAVVLVCLADWVVLLVLGPCWERAILLFRILGVCAATYPANIVFTNMAQAYGAAGPLMRWSVGNAVLVVASLAAGLPFGLVGVAASFAVASVFVRFPYLYWMVGRTTPITLRDFAAAVGPSAARGVVLLAVLAACRLAVDRAVGEVHPAAGAAAFVPLAAAAYWLTLLATPGGRRTLARVRDLAENLRHGKAGA